MPRHSRSSLSIFSDYARRGVEDFCSLENTAEAVKEKWRVAPDEVRAKYDLLAKESLITHAKQVEKRQKFRDTYGKGQRYSSDDSNDSEGTKQDNHRRRGKDAEQRKHIKELKASIPQLTPSEQAMHDVELAKLTLRREKSHIERHERAKKFAVNREIKERRQQRVLEGDSLRNKLNSVADNITSKKDEGPTRPSKRIKTTTSRKPSQRVTEVSRRGKVVPCDSAESESLKVRNTSIHSA